MGSRCSSGFVPLPPALPKEEVNANSQRAFLFTLFIAALLAGAILQAAEPHWLRTVFQVKQPGLYQTGIILFVALAVSVVVHEMGHLLPSLCFGFHVSRIALGPLSAARAHGRWKLQYSRAWFVASVSAIPSDDRAWRFRMLVIVAGGPIASLATFLCSIYLLQSSGPFVNELYLLSVLAQLNLFLFALGLVPNSSNAPVRNDARLFITLMQNSREAEQIRLYHRVTRLQIAGVRPSGYPNELIARLANTPGNNCDLMLFNVLSIFLWALDSGDIFVADMWDRYANALLEGRSLRLADSVLCESACFDVLHRNAPASAAEKLKTKNFETLPRWLEHRATATLQIAEGAYSDALVNLRNARASFPGSLPYFQFELTILEQLEHRAIIASSDDLSAHAAA